MRSQTVNQIGFFTLFTLIFAGMIFQQSFETVVLIAKVFAAMMLAFSVLTALWHGFAIKKDKQT